MAGAIVASEQVMKTGPCDFLKITWGIWCSWQLSQSQGKNRLLSVDAYVYTNKGKSPSGTSASWRSYFIRSHVNQISVLHLSFWAQDVWQCPSAQSCMGACFHLIEHFHICLFFFPHLGCMHPTDQKLKVVNLEELTTSPLEKVYCSMLTNFPWKCDY